MKIHDLFACMVLCVIWGSQGCTSEGYKRQKMIRTRSTTLKWQLDLPLSGRFRPRPRPRTTGFTRCVAVESYASLNMLVVIFGDLRTAVHSHPPSNSSQRKSNMVLSLVCRPDVCQVWFNHHFDSRMWGSVAMEQGQLPFGNFLLRRAKKRALRFTNGERGPPF